MKNRFVSIILAMILIISLNASTALAEEFYLSNLVISVPANAEASQTSQDKIMICCGPDYTSYASIEVIDLEYSGFSIDDVEKLGEEFILENLTRRAIGDMDATYEIITVDGRKCCIAEGMSIDIPSYNNASFLISIFDEDFVILSSASINGDSASVAKEAFSWIDIKNNSDRKKASADVLNNVSISEVTFSIPESWTYSPYETDPLVESTSFTRIGTDGCPRNITCNVVDLCNGYNISESARSSLSGDFCTKQYVKKATSQTDLDTNSIVKATFNDKNFFGYAWDVYVWSAVNMHIVENGYFYSFIFETLSSDDPYEDEYYQDFENMLNSIEFKN